jgi:hypothetical protein
MMVFNKALDLWRNLGSIPAHDKGLPNDPAMPNDCQPLS